MRTYQFTVCGGTFDLFHKGHEELIKKALANGDRVLIGITSDNYIKNYKNKFEIQKFDIRKNAVEEFLIKQNLRNRVILTPIDSAYEPYLETNKEYDSIVVSNQTKKIVALINKKRLDNKLKPLAILISSDVLAEDDSLISSTRIRNGEIDRKGKLFINPAWENKDLILPEKLRNVLQAPWGKVLTQIPQNLKGERTITVGDFTTKQFNTQKIDQYLSVVDFLINREKKYNILSDLGFKTIEYVKVKNHAGVISKRLIKEVIKTFKNTTERKVIIVDGEEDLAVLPIILAAPLGFRVYYGQPGQGTVEILITEHIKEKAYLFVDKFVIS